jgi:hypothetical protein
VKSTRSDQGPARAHFIALFGFLYLNLANPVQPLGKRLGKHGRNVLHDHDRRRVGRQPSEHFLNGIGAAGRSANGDHRHG